MKNETEFLFFCKIFAFVKFALFCYENKKPSTSQTDLSIFEYLNVEFPNAVNCICELLHLKQRTLPTKIGGVLF